MNLLRRSLRGFLLPYGFVALLLLPLGCSSGQEGANNPQPTLAFVGANIVPLTGNETVLRDHTVIVRDGRIAAIGPRRRIAVPADAIQIPASGQYFWSTLTTRRICSSS